MPASEKEHLRNDTYTQKIMTRMAHFDSIESTMNDGIGSRRSRLSDETLADLEEYVNSESIHEMKESLEKTVILQSTDEGITVVPYPLHCEPVYNSEGSQSSSQYSTRSPSPALTAATGTLSSSQSSTATSWELVKETPFDDINASDLSDSERVEEPDHLRHPNPVKIGSRCKEVPTYHNNHIPRHTIYGISGPYPAAGAYRAYSPPSTSGIPFPPSSQDGYPSPRLEPLEAEEEEESMELYESIFGREDEDVFKGCGSMDEAHDEPGEDASDNWEMIDAMEAACNARESLFQNPPT